MPLCVADCVGRCAIYKEAESRKAAFIATVDKYNVDARRHGNVEMDIRANHTWEQVLSMQQGFHEERRKADTPKGLKSFIYTKMRRFGENSETFQACLMLLPTESHYLSVLCGGLKLLLGVRWQYPTVKVLMVLTLIYSRLHNGWRRSGRVFGTLSMRSL